MYMQYDFKQRIKIKRENFLTKVINRYCLYLEKRIIKDIIGLLFLFVVIINNGGCFGIDVEYNASCWHK